MIIIVAPYSPVSLTSTPHLGAARKIEMVIETLSELDSDIMLVNSAHNNLDAVAQIEEIIISGVTVKHYTLTCYSSQKLGKLFNLKDASAAVNKCLEFGNPKLLWLYNSYAFENNFSRILNKKVDVPVIFEFEDWHFSRSRGLNPKPYIDHLLWKLNLKNINFAFGVNDKLVNKMKKFGVSSQLLPGIVPVNLIESCDKSCCFNNKLIKVGYFGGLSVEKGVDKIIEIVEQLPENFKLVISGAGHLETNLQELMEQFSDKLEFHGRVSESQLYTLIASVDVILNPHSPITDMSEGVFPFKVIEGIASGRLLISTPVPSAKVAGLLDGVLFYDGTSNQLLDSIVSSKDFYNNHNEKIIASMCIAREEFSKASILKPILPLIK
ncbi:glycosyltransferase [Psychromonas sp. PT13]|uniref:glycosyltransferase n=1 Tax=Psychromonas sp. PT13 TaxID=3439547 RepID=UPI003EBD3BD6